MLQGPALPASAHGLDRPGHEEPFLAPFEGIGGVDKNRNHLGFGLHLRCSWVSWCRDYRIRATFLLSNPLVSPGGSVLVSPDRAEAMDCDRALAPPVSQ